VYTGNSDYNVFENPLGKADDPWVVKAGGRYYLSWSAGDGIFILESDTLVDIFQGEVHLVWSYLDEGFVGGVWAPELHYLFGRWYLYGACNDHPRFMYVIEGGTNPDNPLDGEYMFVGQLIDGLEDYIIENDIPLGGIDGTVFEYDGEWYYVVSTFSPFWASGQELRIARMVDAYTLASDAVTLTLPIFHYEAMMAWRWEHWINEGPVTLQNDDGGLFMIYSAGASWDNYYCLAILELTGPDLLNPLHWRKYHNPSFERTETVFGPGHNSFVKSPDGTEDWIIYHSARFFRSAWDRVGNMQKFHFGDDGRPVFGIPAEPETKVKVPSGTPFSRDREVIRGELHRTTVFFPAFTAYFDESFNLTIDE
jgi:GH43 family beta-xylosidase